ncbi:hypothetical protein CE91St61_06460 [Lachnospiraceae bacterium]|nr:hypothetical protein CE91St61_06460 [Lachnospiraceae bacterium]
MEGLWLCQHSDKGLSKLKPFDEKNPNIRRAGIKYEDAYKMTSPAWFRLFLQQQRVCLATIA